MTESAVFVGGWSALAVSLFVGLLVVYWTPPEWGNGWTRWRMGAFFVLWQTFTPLNPAVWDFPMMLACMGLMEFGYRAMRVQR